MCRDHSVLLPVKNNTDRMNQLDCRHSCHGGGPCDVSLPVKNNTDRMNQLVR